MNGHITELIFLCYHAQRSSDHIKVTLPTVSAASLSCAADAELKIDNVRDLLTRSIPATYWCRRWLVHDGTRSVIQQSEREQ